MLVFPAAPATAHAVTRVALRADAAAVRLGAGVVALILTLLLRLLARTEAAWDITPEDPATGEYPPYALVLPTMGRAPHAACIEAGLVPDWILPGVRNRGMRPAAAPARRRRRARPVRAPPLPSPRPCRKPPPTGGRRLTP
jgi:hypothetical protein